MGTLREFDTAGDIRKLNTALSMLEVLDKRDSLQQPSDIYKPLTTLAPTATGAEAALGVVCAELLSHYVDNPTEFNELARRYHQHLTSLVGSLLASDKPSVGYENSNRDLGSHTMIMAYSVLCGLIEQELESDNARISEVREKIDRVTGSLRNIASELKSSVREFRYQGKSIPVVLLIESLTTVDTFGSSQSLVMQNRREWLQSIIDIDKQKEAFRKRLAKINWLNEYRSPISPGSSDRSVYYDNSGSAVAVSRSSTLEDIRRISHRLRMTSSYWC